MALVDPKNGRAIIEKYGNDTTIIIPAKKRVFIILFLCAWLGGWFMGETTVIATLINGDSGGMDLFLIFWLFGWTLGGAFALFTVIWNLAGKEIITVSRGLLQIEKKVFGIGISREYLMAEVKNFRIQPSNSYTMLTQRSSFRTLGFGGVILFDYGMKTVKFAPDIDEAEARHIVSLISETPETSI